MLSLSPDAPPALTEVLRESRSHCQRLFEVGLRTHGEALLASPPAYSMDLSVRPYHGINDKLLPHDADVVAAIIKCWLWP